MIDAPAVSEPCELGPNCLRPQDDPRLGKDDKVSWVCCDGCSKWFHDSCVGRTLTTEDDDTPFHCGCIFNTTDGGKRGPCTECHQTFALLGLGSTLRLIRHGPRRKTCQGSVQPPDFRPPPAGFRPLRSTLAEPPTTVEATDLLWPGQTIRSLPTALVPLAAESLTKALQGVCNAPNSTDAWTDLVTWAKRRLIAPSSRLGRAALKRLLREQLSGDGNRNQSPFCSQEPRVSQGRALQGGRWRHSRRFPNSCQRRQSRSAGPGVVRGAARQAPAVCRPCACRRRARATADPHTGATSCGAQPNSGWRRPWP